MPTPLSTTNYPPEASPTNLFLRLVVPLMDSHLTTMLSVLWRLGRRMVNERSYPGDYEILDYEAQLELLDSNGTQAVASKRERVRFLQNNIIAYQDMAWGVGTILADYQCSPGIAVDRYGEGYRSRILISLRDTKHRGDITEFHIRRTIVNGFIKPIESFQHDISHTMQVASFSVIFPKARLPQSVVLIERNSTRRFPLDSKHQTLLADGRLQVTWKTHRPRLFEAYIIEWKW